MRANLQILFLLFLFLAGCRHEEAKPELLDPIFTDLSRQEQDDIAALENERKTLEKAEKSEEEALPLTIDLQNARRELSKSKRKIEFLEQRVTFDHIRTERRKVEDRVNYHKAFLANKDWPPKEEYRLYQVNQRLANAPRSWDAHIPKYFERKPAAKAKKKEGGGEE